MLKKFLRDTRGNYALATIAVAVPLLGGLALAVDYSEMSRERELTLNALDAAGIATARRIVEGATDAEATTYARNFFNANLGTLDPNRVTLSIVLPQNNLSGGGTLKMTATLGYQSAFFGAFERLRGNTPANLNFTATSEVKLKNTIEVAMALDNSGSMDETGSGSGKKRMTLLKEAAKQLVDTMAAQGAQMKQLQRPVQFGLVPFAASVNVGPSNSGESWMDTTGVSPVHHENFNWASLNYSGSTRTVQQSGNQWIAKGADWGTLVNQPVTRFSVYNSLRAVTGETRTPVTTTTQVCTASILGYCLKWENRTTTTYNVTQTYGNVGAWEGCVESRPYPYNVTDETASKSTPATLFVPMFAPDEGDNANAPNSWWADPNATDAVRDRQRDMNKYFTAGANGTTIAAHAGPNYSCTTSPILPLTDVTTSTGATKVKAAIDDMSSGGATNVPEGMSWGWRVLSSKAPFTGGRTETEGGNDKVLIVLTDGANTYYAPNSLSNGSGGRFADNANNRSTYSSYGYVGQGYNGTTTPRLFMNTSSSVSKSTYDNANYSKAMNEHFAALCDNAKAAKITVMTVALDLDVKNASDKAQYDALQACASPSKTRRDSTGAAAKLFWNATGGSLANDFKSIADELSNLRIVS